MPDTQALMARGGDLKQQLVEFALSRRYQRALDDKLAETYPDALALDDSQLVAALDSFITSYRLKDGRTVVEHFVARHPELPEAERSMLLGWRDAVDGVFQIERREGGALVLFNLIDELTYRAHSNTGPAVLRDMKPGKFLISRIVPVGDEWMMSGMQQLYSARDRPGVVAAANQMLVTHPRLAFRNPEKLEQAWAFQRQDRTDFVAFFGSDTVVMPGHAVAERYRAYMHFKYTECRGEDGKTIVERVRELGEPAPEPPEMPWSDHIAAADSVGLIYDEVDGMNFFPDFGLVEEAFVNPDLLRKRRHRTAVLEFLESPDIIPLPLRRLAERHPEQADRVWQRLLKRPRFSWEQDGEALLRRYKPDYYARPPVPGVAPAGESLSEDLPVSDGGRSRRVRRRRRDR